MMDAKSEGVGTGAIREIPERAKIDGAPEPPRADRPPPAPPAPSARPARLTSERIRYEAWRFVELTALAGLAFAQPLLDVFGKSPDVFIASSLSATSILVFAVGLVLIPPLILWMVTALFAIGGKALEAQAHRVAMCLLVGAFVAQAVAATFVTPATVALALAAAVGFGFLVARFSATRLWVRFLAIAPAGFLVLFIFASGATPLIIESSADSAAVTTSATNHSVVMLVFDELPLESLLDGKGRINAIDFPNFATLQRESSWYRNTSSVAGWTNYAVPAIVAGQVNAGKNPSNNDNLFNLLGSTHDLYAREPITRYCPPSKCKTESAGSGSLGSFADQAVRTWITRIAEPSPSATGSAPVDDAEPTDQVDLEAFDDAVLAGKHHESEYLESFAQQLTGSESRPQFAFAHIVVPHRPWDLTPSGRRFEEHRPPETNGDTWATGAGTDEHRLAHMLSLQYADKLLGTVIDRLKETGGWDDTILVVTADHGMSFTNGDKMRQGTTTNQADVLWVPLFIRAPELPEGLVSDRPTLSVDIVPTIIDILGITSAYPMDGLSVRDKTEREDLRPVYPPTWNKIPSGSKTPLPIDGKSNFAKALKGAPLGQGSDDLRIYRFGPDANLVGTPEPDDAPIDPGASVKITSGTSTIDFDPDSGRIDAQVVGEVTGLRASGKPPQRLAVGLNGTIVRAVGFSGPSFWFTIPEGRLQPGPNELHFYLIDGPEGRGTLTRVEVSP